MQIDREGKTQVKTLKQLIVYIGRIDQKKGKEEVHKTKEEKIQRDRGRKGKKEGSKGKKEGKRKGSEKGSHKYYLS